MTNRDIDRLTSRTLLTPASKRALRHIRQSMLRGIVGDPEVGESEWSVGVDDLNGAGYRVPFSFKKVKDD